jgi:hypothetical protein
MIKVASSVLRKLNQEKSENDDSQNMGFMGGEMRPSIELVCRPRVCYRVCKCSIFPVLAAEHLILLV